MHRLSPQRQKLAGIALVILGAIGFSGKAILVKLAYAESSQVDAIVLMTLRMLLSLPFFLLVAWRSGYQSEHRHPMRDWAALLLLGVMGYYFASYLDFAGLQYITAGLERLILFLYPSIVLLLSAMIHRQAVTLQQWLALLLSYGGILLVFDAPEGQSQQLLGALLVFASAVIFALFITGSGHYIPRFGPRRFTAWCMSIACIATLLHFLLSRPLEQLAVPREVWILALLMALFSTVLPAFLINAGMRRIGASQTAIVSSIGPIATMIMGYYILEEPLGPAQCAGAGLVIAGVGLVSLQKNSPQP